MYLRLKDSKAVVGVHDCATGKVLEGTDRQTDFPCIIVRCTLVVLIYGSETWTLTHTAWLQITGWIPHMMSTMDPSHQMVWSHQRWSHMLHLSALCFIHQIKVQMHYSVTLPDLLMMSQQMRSFRPAVELKMVSGHLPTGGMLEVDLSPPGLIRSAGTREYRWSML